MARILTLHRHVNVSENMQHMTYIVYCKIFTSELPALAVLGRTFVMVQLCHSNDFGHSSFVDRLLFGFLPYFLPLSL
jgi:hypothetical protein